MTQIYLIFILIMMLSFSLFNAGFEKKHNNKSVLQEKKVKNTIETVTLIDGIMRTFTDVSLFFG